MSQSASVPLSAETSRPTLIACSPRGTRIEMSIRAGSEGWSFEGNHHAALSGSPETSHSWPVRVQG